jgi:hypothetical protein
MYVRRHGASFVATFLSAIRLYLWGANTSTRLEISPFTGSNVSEWIVFMPFSSLKFFCYLTKNIFMFIKKNSELLCQTFSNFTYTGIDVRLHQFVNKYMMSTL